MRGHQMNLIERVCKCGCGKTFKCLEVSGQLYLNKLHIYAETMKNTDSYSARVRRGTVVHEDWKYKQLTQSKSSLKSDTEDISLTENTLIQ